MKLKTLFSTILVGLSASLICTAAQADIIYHLRDGDSDITAPKDGKSVDSYMGYSDARKPQKTMLFLGVTGTSQYTFSDWHDWLSVIKDDDVSSSEFYADENFLQSQDFAYLQARPAFLFVQESGQLTIPKSGNNVFEVVLSRYNIDEYPVALYAKGVGAQLNMQAPYAAIEHQGYSYNPLSDEYAIAPYAAYATNSGKISLGDVNADQVAFATSNGGMITIDGTMHAGDSVFYPVGVVFKTKADDVFVQQPTIQKGDSDAKDPRLSLPLPATSEGIINLILQKGSRVALGLNNGSSDDNQGKPAQTFDSNSSVTNLVLANDAQVSISNNWLQVLYSDRWCHSDTKNDTHTCINAKPENATFGDYSSNENGNYDRIAAQGFGATTQVEYRFFNPNSHDTAFAKGTIQEALTESQDYILGNLGNKDVEPFKGRTLTVEGDYASLSDNNLLVFTVVADSSQDYTSASSQPKNADTSLHDQLIINGRAVGTTKVQVYLVNNVTVYDEEATPAITQNGIPLITVKAQNVANGFITHAEKKPKEPMFTLPKGTDAEKLPSAKFELASPVVYGNLTYNLSQCGDTWYLYNNSNWACNRANVDPKGKKPDVNDPVQAVKLAKAAYRSSGSTYLATISQSLTQFSNAELLVQTSPLNMARLPANAGAHRVAAASTHPQIQWVLSAKHKAQKTLVSKVEPAMDSDDNQVSVWVNGAYQHSSFLGTDDQYKTKQHGSSWMLGIDKSLNTSVGLVQFGGFFGLSFSNSSTAPSGKVKFDFPSTSNIKSTSYALGFYGNLSPNQALQGGLAQLALSVQQSKNRLTDMLSRQMDFNIMQLNLMLGYSHDFTLMKTNNLESESRLSLVPSASMQISYIDMDDLKSSSHPKTAVNLVSLDSHFISIVDLGLRLNYQGQARQSGLKWNMYLASRLHKRILNPEVRFELTNSVESLAGGSTRTHLELGGGISSGRWYTGLSAYYSMGSHKYKALGVNAEVRVSF